MRENKDKWMKKVTERLPCNDKRKRGRQIKRWEDDISRTAGPVWLRKARYREEWKLLEEAYVQGQAVKRKHTGLPI